MIVVLLILILILFYWYGSRNHDYWAKRNIKHKKPIFLFGNNLRNFIGKESVTQIFTKLYNDYPNERVVGYYRGTTPELLIRDPDIVRRILSVDFMYFHRRGLGRNPQVEPLMTNLFQVDGDLWRLLRQRLTPAFTTAKLKAMFPLVVQCAEKLQAVAEETARGVRSEGGQCDVRELMARYTTEFIGACGFGVDMDTINNGSSAFRGLGKAIFTRTFGVMFRNTLWDLFPFLRDFIYVGNPKVEQTITDVLKGVRKQRNYEVSERKDFIDLLVELEKKGAMTGESIERFDADGKPEALQIEMDLNIMIGQVFVFFAAGFETSSSATSFTLNELAYNPAIQSQIQEEIDRVLLKYDNKLCYDAVAEMSLLAMAFKEAMRIFPSLGVLNRVCVRQYTIPEIGLTIDPGVKIIIPIQAMHMDEKYFDNPTEFRPERFAAEEVSRRHKYVYLPFGVGPRACIGERLGEMQSLAGLASVLRRASVAPAPASCRSPLVESTSNVVQGVRGGIPLILKER